jgi:hypothetical protein
LVLTESVAKEITMTQEKVTEKRTRNTPKSEAISEAQNMQQFEVMKDQASSAREIVYRDDDYNGLDYNPNDVFPDFAVEPQEVARRTQMLKDYVREHMNEGEDYGIVPGGSKPTLFKPGAEKLNAVYGLSVMVQVLNRIENWDDGFVAYEVKVTLVNKRTNIAEAEGIGSCNSRERRYKNQDAAGVANTILKMAKKRALVDATLSATRASGMFTQDLEDIDFEPERSNYAPRESRQSDREGQRSTTRSTPQNAPQSAAPSDLITEAQQRAIMAIAGRVFGRHSRDEDLIRLTNKPLEELTKSEASGLIDQLRAMLNEGGAPSLATEAPKFVSANERAQRNNTR